MTERHYQPGDLVFEEGEDAAFVCRIVSGKAELVRGHGAQQVVVDRLGPGDVTESMAVLEGQRRTAGLRAVTDLSIEIIEKQRFLRRVAGDSELAFKLLMYLSDRLHTMQNQAARPANPQPAARPAGAPPAAGPAPRSVGAAAAPSTERPPAGDTSRAPAPAQKAAGAATPQRPPEPRPPADAPPRPAPAGASALNLRTDAPEPAPPARHAPADQVATQAILQMEERPVEPWADSSAPSAKHSGGDTAPASAPPKAATPAKQAAAPAEARHAPQARSEPAVKPSGYHAERFPWDPTPGKARPNARIRIVPASELMTHVMPLEGIVVDRLPFLVGRRTDKTERQVWVDLAIGDTRPYRLSRAHFSLTMRDGQYILCDLDSAHGTQVNGTPLGRDGSTDFAPLLDGDNLVVAGGRDSPYSFHVVVEQS